MSTMQLPDSDEPPYLHDGEHALFQYLPVAFDLAAGSKCLLRGHLRRHPDLLVISQSVTWTNSELEIASELAGKIVQAGLLLPGILEYLSNLRPGQASRLSAVAEALGMDWSVPPNLVAVTEPFPEQYCGAWQIAEWEYTQGQIPGLTRRRVLEGWVHISPQNTVDSTSPRGMACARMHDPHDGSWELRVADQIFQPQAQDGQLIWQSRTFARQYVHSSRPDVGEKDGGELHTKQSELKVGRFIWRLADPSGTGRNLVGKHLSLSKGAGGSIATCVLSRV